MFDAMDFNSWDNAEQKAIQAYELYEMGQMDQALEFLREAIEINPENGAWHFNAGLTLDAMGRYEEAIESFKLALIYNTEDPEILNSLAVDYTRIGQYDLALATFEIIQELEPTFEPCYCNRIITYTEIDRHDLAEEMFYLAQQINPDCPICFYNIGNSLFSRREYKKAIWCWQKTALLEPTHPQINYRIAQAYWANGESESAKKHFLQEVRTNPGDVDVLLDFGIFLIKQGQHEEGIEKFKRIIELDPGAAAARFYLGESYLMKEKHQQALEEYKSALKIMPSMAGPRFRLAQIEKSKGDFENALKHLRTEAGLSVDDPDVLLSMGTMLMELGDYDYSTDCFLRIVDEDPLNTDAFYNLGVALVMREDFEGAIQFLEHVSKLRGGDGAILTEAAALALASGQLDQAQDLIKQTKEIKYENKQLSILDLQLRFKTAMQNCKTRFKNLLKLGGRTAVTKKRLKDKKKLNS